MEHRHINPYSEGLDPLDSADVLVEATGLVADRVEQLREYGHEFSLDERLVLLEAANADVQDIHDRIQAAGELAGKGDPLGAIALMGGEQNARDLIGDETVDELMEQIIRQMTEEE